MIKKYLSFCCPQVFSSTALEIFEKLLIGNYINPTDPAVKPTTKKKANSKRSLGRELTNKFN